MGAFMAVRAAGPGVVTIDRAHAADPEVVPGRRELRRVSRPDKRQQCIDDVFGQPVRAEPLRVLNTDHGLSFLSYLY